MRIDRLDLIAYGSFKNESLDLSEGSFGLHLIYGDNEAGKSTSLRALIAWLFGIPLRTNDNYHFKNTQLRIGGKLRNSNNDAIEFMRRKGRKGTLIEYGTEAELDDSALAPFLHGNIDANLFEQLYGINYSRLIAGGQELLNQSGDIGQALFASAAGITDLHEILSDLNNTADNLFKPRGSTKFVNQAIANYKNAKRSIKSSMIPVAQWKKLQKDLKDIQANIQRAESEIVARGKIKSRLDRINRVKGALAEYRAAIDRITDLGNVLDLPEDFSEKLKTANHNLRTSLENKKKIGIKLSRANKTLESLNVRNELLDHEEEIISIHKELGATEKSLNDRPTIDAKRRTHRNQAERLLKNFRPDLDIDDAVDLRPLTNNKRWISDLSQKHSLLNQEKKKTETSLRDLEDELITINKELSSLTHHSFDLDELKAEVKAARKAGDLEDRLADLQKQILDSKTKCDNQLSRLGRYAGSVDSLSTLSIPVSSTLDAYEKSFDTLETELRDLSRKNDEITYEHMQAEHELKALLSIKDVPTDSDLENARKFRDTGWLLIKQKYIENIDVENEIAEYAANSYLPDSYEQNVEMADQVSDNLREYADQVAQRSNLELKIGFQKQRIHKISNEIEKINTDKKSLEIEWNNIWKPLGIDPGMPGEMKEWLLRVYRLAENAQEVNSLSDKTLKVAGECHRLKESISIQVKKFDPSINSENLSLESLLLLCEQRIEKEASILKRKRELELSLNSIDVRKKRVLDDLSSTKNDLHEWEQEWSKAISGLGLSPDVHPKQATAVFDQLINFFEEYDESEKLRRRIYGIDQVEEKFKKLVFEFTDKIFFEKDAKTAEEIASQLNKKLNDAREVRASFEKITAQKIEFEDDIKDIEIEIRSAQDQISDLKNTAKAQNDEELETIAEKSQTKRALQKKLKSLEQELARNGDGLSVQDLEIEAGESDVDTIGNELEIVSSELDDLHSKRDALRDMRQTLQNNLDAMDGTAVAARASEEAEQHMSAIIIGSEKFLRMKISALILEQQIEKFRKDNQAPVLSRAGKIFSKLTLESYKYLRDELDAKNKPILHGVRPNNDEVKIDEMSDGTRDQLYLALRLATLEQHLGSGEPMPFIVDDILVGFDDNRAKVCIEILSELAEKTQVILFSHHKRILELANEIESTSGIYNHELS